MPEANCYVDANHVRTLVVFGRAARVRDRIFRPWFNQTIHFGFLYTRGLQTTARGRNSSRKAVSFGPQRHI